MQSKTEGRTSLDGYTVEYSTSFQKVDHDTRHVRLGHNDLRPLAHTSYSRHTAGNMKRQPLRHHASKVIRCQAQFLLKLFEYC
ncbi:hypothetical protein [Streptomyces mirabilis]|uniref:hypothetical protein n=1 Tax=Streptomyces mirabilis TaxID=68239 RepID=UPI00367ED930